MQTKTIWYEIEDTLMRTIQGSVNKDEVTRLSKLIDNIITMYEVLQNI
jgi:hypothetical protein